MPAKDFYHDVVKNALIKDGWTITHDPYALKIGSMDMYIDLGAERLIAAEKGKEKIAVEVKSFIGPSVLNDLEKALGQYILYHDVLEEREPERVLYLGVPKSILRQVFEEPLGRILLKKRRVRLVIFDIAQEAILQWIE